MRKIIFSINVTVDGFADHTAVIADDELHDFYTDLLSDSDTLLFGRKTYQLFESFWPEAAEDPRCTNSMATFADKINKISKIVFSSTLDSAHWKNTRLSKANLGEEVMRLKQQTGRNISIAGLSIASALMKLEMIDEYWFLIQPIILGKGRKLFEIISNPSGEKSNLKLKLLNKQKLSSGVVALHYEK